MLFEHLILVSIGLTWILMYGSILNPIRNILLRWEFFRELLKCGLCTGTWSGFFVYFTSAPPEWYLFPLAAAGCCYIADLLFFKLLPEIHDFFININKKMLDEQQ